MRAESQGAVVTLLEPRGSAPITGWLGNHHSTPGGPQSVDRDVVGRERAFVDEATGCVSMRNDHKLGSLK